MISKLQRIPDKTIFRAIFALIICWNLKYFFLPIQVPYTLLFVDYIKSNSFFSQIIDIKKTIKEIPEFQDTGKTGFVSDTHQNSVFDKENSIKDFYIAQFAIVPSVLKNDTEQNFVIGVYKTPQTTPPIPTNFQIYKKINPQTYLYKRTKK